MICRRSSWYTRSRRSAGNSALRPPGCRSVDGPVSSPVCGVGSMTDEVRERVLRGSAPSVTSPCPERPHVTRPFPDGTYRHGVTHRTGAAPVCLIHGAATTGAVWRHVRSELGELSIACPDRAASGSMAAEVADLTPLAR